MKRHRTDALSLSAGVVFVATGAIWLLDTFAGLSRRAVIAGFVVVVMLVAIIAVSQVFARPRSSKTDNS